MRDKAKALARAVMAILHIDHAHATVHEPIDDLCLTQFGLPCSAFHQGYLRICGIALACISYTCDEHREQ